MLAVLATASLTSCKKIYFRVSEEANDNKANRFAITEAYYQMGKSIALTGGRYELTPSDSIVLFIEGQGKVTGIGGDGVVGLDYAQTARFFMTLPVRLQPKNYDTRFRSICEITGSLNYGAGENLFVCQSGQVVIDSLKKDTVYGTFKGTYLNTSNRTLSVDGPFTAGLKGN